MCSEPVLWRLLSRKVPLFLVPGWCWICGQSCVAHSCEPLSQVTCWEDGQKEVHISCVDGMVRSLHLELADPSLHGCQVLQNPCFVCMFVYFLLIIWVYWVPSTHHWFCNLHPDQVVAQSIFERPLHCSCVNLPTFIYCFCWRYSVFGSTLVDLVVERSVLVLKCL